MNATPGPLRAILHTLEEELQGLATVRTQEPTPDGQGPGLLVKVVPVNSNAATIEVHVESPNQVDLDIGVGSHAELYSKSPEEVVEQLKEVIEAVINGNFEETAWQKGGRVVRAKGVLYFERDSRTVHYWNMGALFTFTRSERLDQRYEPYGADAIKLG